MATQSNPKEAQALSNQVGTLIVELSDKWYEYVAKDHHKDRDCHFYIETAYSYGEEPTYTATHYGYVGRDFSFQAGTYEAAERLLYRAMQEMVDNEEEWVNGVLDNLDAYDDTQCEKARLFKKLFRVDDQGNDLVASDRNAKNSTANPPKQGSAGISKEGVDTE